MGVSVRPPSGQGEIEASYQGLKPLATIVRPPGEEGNRTAGAGGGFLPAVR